MSEYTLLLKTELDVSNIQAQLDALAGKYKISVNAEINATGLQGITSQAAEAQKAIASGAKQTSIIDPEKNKKILEDIEAQAKSVQAAVGSTAAKTVTNQDYVDGVLKSAKVQNTFTDELGKTTVASTQFKAATDKTSSSLKTNVKTVSDVDKASKLMSNNWITEMTSVIKRTIQWSVALGVLYGSFQSLQEGIQYIKDLNKSLNETQIVTNMSDKEIQNLSTDANKLAQSMGATTLQVTDGALEWFRQGKTAQEALQLTQSSLMLSKLGNIEAGQATEYLTATLNGYKLEAADANSVIDKMIAIDNSAATSSAELATALQYSAASAQQAGVSIEELLSYIGTISSVTRTSAESVGQSLKSMFARMENVKAGATEDGIALNNVEKSLAGVGIALRTEDQKSFRPMGDVLSDMAAKWGDLDSIQQNELATAVGGLRQRSQFLVLMTNWNEVLREQQVETNSAGLAASRYQIYLASVAAAADRMKASWEGVWQKTINTGGIKFFYDLSSAVGNAISAMGGLIPITIAVIANILFMNGAAVVGAFINLQKQIGDVIASFVAQAAAAETAGVATMTALGAAGLVLAAGMIAWSLYRSVVKSTDEQLQALATDVSKLSSELKTLHSQQNEMSGLWTDFTKLSEKVSKTNDEQIKFRDIQNQLKQILPEISGAYDDQGNFILDESVNLGVLLKLQQQKIDLDQQELNAKHAEQLKLEAKQYLDQQKALADLLKLQKLQQASPNARSVGGHVVSPEEIAKEKASLDSLLNTLEQLYVISDAAGKIKIIDYLNSMGDAGKEAAKNILLLQNQTTSLTGSLGELGDAAQKVAWETSKEFDALLKATISLIKQQKQAEADAIEDKLKALKDAADEEKTIIQSVYDDRKAKLDSEIDLLKRAYDEEKRLRDEKKQAVKDELDGYEKIIDAEEKLLEIKHAQETYENQRADKQKALAKLQEQIAAVSLDTSAEGIAKRKELEDQAAKLKEEIDNNTADHTYDLEKNALEKERQDAKDRADLRLKELEDIQRQAELEYQLRLQALEDEKQASQDHYDLKIKEIETESAAKEKALQDDLDKIHEYLSQEGTIANDARAMMADQNSDLYQKLIDWNHKYGTGLDTDIVQMWDSAKAAVADYILSLQGVLDVQKQINDAQGYGMGTTLANDPLHAHHSGLDSGFIGGKAKTKSNEEFAKLLKGEIVINPQQMDNFMRSVLPSLPSMDRGGSGGDLNLDHLIEIQGNVNSDTMPDLERALDKAVQKLTDAMKNRGMVRSANSFSV